MTMKGQWLIIVKSFVKGSLDVCLLPGTVAGTEILLAYAGRWKHKVAKLPGALLYLRLGPVRETSRRPQ